MLTEKKDELIKEVEEGLSNQDLLKVDEVFSNFVSYSLDPEKVSCFDWFDYIYILSNSLINPFCVCVCRE